MATNWQGMQSAGAKKKAAGNPGNVLTRYLTGGYWKASLSRGGEFHGKRKRKS